MSQIAPHGGTLVDRELTGNDREQWLEKATDLKKVQLNSREISDIEMIATGAMSPLEGFMKQTDYEAVLQNKRLASGLIWSLPVTLTVTEEEAGKHQPGDNIALTDGNRVIGILHLEESYKIDREKEALLVYGTDELAHPGVQYIFDNGDHCLGGKISLLERPQHSEFTEFRLDPKDTREAFKQRGWSKIVGFQTRNPVHRAHEYIQKCAMEIVDGLLLHPLVGDTKSDDIPADVRMECYEVLLENYYPKDRAMLSVFPAAMRYGGPREAVFHAIVRKNYGCTHFIVGRDHAGVGSYYGSFDAHYIFDEFEPGELDITPLFFDHTFYCKKCEGMASFKTCPHEPTDRIILSGTKVRDMLNNGEVLPGEFSRREVAEVLMRSVKV